ncbi:unnamed protein product [Acanthoscelides obtectus]|uniref:DDE-1 domain-containing protein n=1 Tax=Acanthoscelides obtectus TaxID=200917 RepID=A0A9P0MHB4_ACAOB|nr:unnamed protein product [Acanthoscelides obtectus]CAK1636448.1 hypothetical protein AOBTE_LOCUS9853 [Acanthoscelides obtectus]
MKFFVSNVRPNEDHKCLLILDNHASHRSIDVLDYASQNDVIILSVPAHTTQRVTLFDVGKIFNNAYLKAATPTNAIKGPY